MTAKTLLVDGDIVAFQSCAAAETEVDWGDDLWTLHTDLAKAKEEFARKLARGLEVTGCDKALVCLTSADNWRLSVLPTYKGNRKKTRKPVGYPALIAWIEENFETYRRPTLEADDILGILATHPKAVPGEKVVWSEDKDLKTIPCTLYDGDTIREISVEEADNWHFMQTLTGDTTDGYSGCPGVGAVKAAKIIDNKRNPWPAIVAAYVKAGLSEEVALQMARVARICRHTDYDLKTKSVRLWTPT